MNLSLFIRIYITLNNFKYSSNSAPAINITVIVYLLFQKTPGHKTYCLAMLKIQVSLKNILIFAF